VSADYRILLHRFVRELEISRDKEELGCMIRRDEDFTVFISIRHLAGQSRENDRVIQ
jgi:hypothetical protein